MNDFKYLVYQLRSVADLIAGFASANDALTFVKAANFPRDFQIRKSETDEVIFDTRGKSILQVGMATL